MVTIKLTRSQAATGVRLAVNQRHTIILLQQKTVRLIGFTFDLEKAFLLPDALPGIRKLAERCRTWSATNVLIVGHTDQTGKSDYNLALSKKRARMVAAYLSDDADAWLPAYEDSDEDQRWGPREDRLMLGAVLDGQGTPYMHGKTTFASAVRLFQADFGLKVDGDCGPKTRALLVPAYMALDGTTLPDKVVIEVLGAGDGHPRADLPTDHADQRRVEAFLSPEPFVPPLGRSLPNQWSTKHGSGCPAQPSMCESMRHLR